MRCVPGAFITCLFCVLAGAVPAAESIDVYSVQPITDDYFDGGYPDAAPRGEQRIRVVLTPGEYEPGSFVVRAGEQAAEVQLSATPLINAEGLELAGAEVDIRVVKRWYQRNFGGQSPQKYRYLTSELLVYNDRLVRAEDQRNYLLLEGEYTDISAAANLNVFLSPGPDELPVKDAQSLQPVQLQPAEARQFWVTVFVPPGTPAGVYTAMIEHRADDAVIATLPLEVEVLPFSLADPMLEYGIYYRGRLDRQRPEGSVSSEVKSAAQMRADFENLSAHGISSPIIYQRWSTGLLPDVLTLAQEAGLRSKNLYTLSVSIVPNDEGVITPRLGEEVRAAIKLAAEYGYEDVYFYARDEARGDELAYQFPFWDEVRRNGGKVMSAGWPQTTMYPGNFNTTGGKEDLYVALGTLTRAEAARWHGKGRRIYSYQNPTGGYELPEAWRRNYGLLLWQYDYDGAFPYAWQHSFGDGWNDFDHNRYRDHNFTYPTVDKPIDTVQWEAFREGVDDVRYLSTLLALLDDPGSRDSKHFDAAQAWVSKLRDRPLAPTDLDAVRAEMVGFILGLKGLDRVKENAVVVAGPRLLPIDTDGAAVVEWSTDERTGVTLAGGNNKLVGTAPAQRSHKVTIPAAARDAFTEFTLQPGGVRAALDSGKGLEVLRADSLRSDGETYVEASIRTNWRSSLGINAGNSLRGWWRFSGSGETLADQSGFGHDGELEGDAERAAGRFGRGVNLSRAGSFISLPDIEIEENGTGTIEGWFRFRSFAKDRVKHMALFSGLYQHGDNNHFYFLRTNEHFQVGSYLTRNTWHHIALTWNGNTATARLYVDGQNIPVNILGQPEEIREIDGLTVGRSIGFLGGLVDASRSSLDGDVDELRVWNRVLSEAEVKASWLSEAGRLRVPLAGPAGQGWKIFGVNAAGTELPAR